MRNFNILARELTLSTSEVLIYHGETELTRILSFAHSHAKFFVIWFIAPEKQGSGNLKPINSCHLARTKYKILWCYFTFRCCIDGTTIYGNNPTNGGDEYNTALSWCFKERMSKLAHMKSRFKVGGHKEWEFLRGIIRSRLPYVCSNIVYLEYAKRTLGSSFLECKSKTWYLQVAMIKPLHKQYSTNCC